MSKKLDIFIGYVSAIELLQGDIHTVIKNLKNLEREHLDMEDHYLKFDTISNMYELHAFKYETATE